MTSAQKIIKYAAIAFAILLAVGIIGGIVSAVLSTVSFFDDSEYVGEMQTYEVSGGITELELEINAATLSVKTGDTFCVKSNLTQLRVKEKNGKLTISEETRFANISHSKAVVELYIPKGTVFEKADIAAGAGVFTVETLSAETLLLEFGAGEAEIDELNAFSRAEIDGGAGEISIGSGTLAELDFDMGVGELRLTSKLTGDCDLDCGVGDTLVTLLGTAEEYRIDIDKGLGDAIVGGEKANDGDVFGSGENRLSVDSGVGKIEIRFE